MSQSKKIFVSILLVISILTLSIPSHPASALTPIFPFVILSDYHTTADIGDEIYLIAVTSNGKSPTWKSSSSSIASVNTYGIVTAKKAGKAVITAKIKDAEASCLITVNKTKITISTTSASIERGETLKLSATTSNDSQVTWKSSKKSIATINEYGKAIGLKPGETTITATADGSSVTCFLTVKAPIVRLNKSSVKLYHGETTKLTATVSSNVNPTWKSNKKSVAIVDGSGNVTAVKNGIATITATVDGISAICEVIVQKPEITLSSSEIYLKIGDSTIITALVSFKSSPVWSTSNSNIVTVNSKGEVKALKKGKAYVYASDDGTKVRCTVHVTD